MIAICGMSGLVGSKLEKMFSSHGEEVVALRVRDNTDVQELANTLEKCDTLINLSGTSILARWSEPYKKSLYDSRINTTKKLVDAMSTCRDKPKLFISTSAVGIYASNKPQNDDSTEYENDFLSTLCQDWEAEANRAKELGIRCLQTRFGVVYASEGGAMSKMLPPFKLGLGGKVGSGEQIVSWIHIDDLLRAIEFIIKTPAIEGSVNFTSPSPSSNLEQTKIIGKVLNRPTFFAVPSFVLKLIFGEGSSVILDSKEVYPSKLLENGFVFNYEKFEDALEDILVL
ncbi:TIGR01777 family oxidoreductase [Sulfurimonas sp.]|nr:TIGR01777 family oxidoreductase [Sulfurimonas sp.]